MTFRIYMRGDPGGDNWHGNPSTDHSGDLVYIGVSQLTPPVANTLTNAAIIPKSNGTTVLSPVLSGTTSRPASITLSSYTITSLPTSGTLTYSGGAVAVGTVIPAAQISTLSYTPVGTGFAGNSVSFTYNTTDSNGALSAGNNSSGTITGGDATYTIPLGVADVATTITGPTAVGAGQPTGNFTATFSNAGTVPAAAATQTVTLPTGAGLTVAQKATIVAAYSGTTFLTTGAGTGAVTTITFPTATLAVGASSSYVFAYTAPITLGTYTTTSTTSTTTAENVTSNNTASTASAPLVVSAAADVTVSLTGPTTLNAGQPTGTYTATFINEGPNAAAAVSRAITLPQGASLSGAQQADLITRYGLTVASFSTTGSGASAVTTINFGSVASLANNATSVVTFAFTAPDAVSTALTLTGTTGTTTSEGANIAPNTTALTLATVTTADVAATITSSATATVGTFNVSFGNNGPQTATGIVRTVQLPANLTGVTFTGDAALATYNASTGLVTYPATTTTITPGSAASGSPLTSAISYNLASSVTPATATASVSTTTNEGGIIANNTASAVMTTGFDLTTTLTGPITAVVGSPITLFVTTANSGPNTAPSATQTVTIPSAATLAGNIFITNGGTYSYDGTLKIGTVTFPALANLPGGQTVTNSISFLAPTANFAPTANVAAGGTSATVVESNTTNNSANLNAGASGTSVAVTAPVGASTNESTSIKATVGTSTTPANIVGPGSVVTYTVTSTNNGPTATTNVVEQVQLLPGLTTASLTVGGTTGTLVLGKLQFVTTSGTSSYDPTTGVLTYYTVPAQTIGTTTTYDKLAVTTPASIGNNGQLLATAVVTTSQLDAVPADNTASVGVRVKTIPDLVATIAGPSTTVAGLPATYVVKFANNGTNDATAVTETAQLPAGLGNVVVTDATGAVVPGAYNSVTGLITFPSLPTDAVGANQSFTIVLTAPGQNFPVTSTIASVTSAGTSTNKSASLATAVSPNADLAVSITGPVVAVIGNSITYIVTTTNNGPTTASNVAATIQLPVGLTGVSSGPGGSATVNASGLYTFATTATLVPGGSVINYITFTMPGPASGEVSAVASVSSAVTDQVPSNNTAGLTTRVAPATPETTADLVTSISPTAISVPAGSVVTYTAAYRNAGTTDATNVMPTVNLPTSLLVTDLKVGGATGTLSGNLITFGAGSGTASGATYNTATGLLTFPTVATLAPSATANSYLIAFPAPVGSGQLVVISEVASSTSESDFTLNRANSSIGINTVYDVTTTLAGPAMAQPGITNTYTVTTLNGGPSLTSNATTQTVTLPAGVTATNISGSGTQTGATITWTIPANQPGGVANEVVNSFSVVMPVSGSLPLSAAVANAGETVNTLPNTATLTTTQANIAPVAQNMWNTLRGPQGNTAILGAPNGLAISPLTATDVDGIIASYTVTKAPPATQGTLYYFNGTSYIPVVDNTPVGDGTKLFFAPNSSYVGDATFAYTATDNGNGTPANALASPPAIYTIPVAKDIASMYATITKGGNANVYNNNDVVGYVIDPNAALYNPSGLIYNADGTPATGTVNNGIQSASISAADVANLATKGIVFNTTTGVFSVVDRTKLPRAGTTIPVSVTTTDLLGGVNVQTVSLVLGVNPLPVELTDFTATAVKNTDATLVWHTASEKNNDHFDVERSLTGSEFMKIGQVKGQGTSTAPTAYALTDAGIGPKAQGLVYYRLKQVDTDGTTTYSPVRTVAFAPLAEKPAISLYPNPATASTQLDLRLLPAGTYQVRVLDALGRVVLGTVLEAGLTHALDLNTVASGTYQVLVNGQHLSLTTRLVKE